ncbi:MAG TPA: aminoglycoside phosphotransferase [Alphaproteobacteria bacterium]|nr:aminoglycoside phosphotransferase [Alphaproteobacteria bacterium]
MTAPTKERGLAIEEFLAANGWPNAEHGRLAADASFRRYERVIDTGTGRLAVLMDAPPDLEDVHAFAIMARHLRRLGFSAPEVLAEDSGNGFLLLEDFGDDTFTRLLAAGESEEELYALAVDMLAALHDLPAADAAPGWLDAYGEEKLLEEASLLTDWYLPAVSGKETAAATRDAYLAAWRTVLPIVHGQPRALVLRDYHVDNLLRLEGRDGVRACGLLDFQDAVAGPAAYDLVSLLEDARRDVGDDLVQTMQARYFDAMMDTMKDTDRESFIAAYAVLGAQRHAKVIGVFARLSRRDGKDGYLRHIPRVWRLLERAIENPLLGPLKTWFDAYAPPDLRRRPEKLG